ncbi:MAG: endoplasmic reticulum vesicle transporter-domain-containing protein [Olpidium bornovanus]|uniref:Endoplasmic reticulum vesicle transporter-domain-containing protein n=1 Tax=Olpidium bornovanus TaxID=278681 RepID=A0A8H8A1N6_9FUNG|nr:MAG: endoplasmic reticulum vesicle transporter-domain-containing protein [Olpidium bornovanus]
MNPQDPHPPRPLLWARPEADRFSPSRLLVFPSVTVISGLCIVALLVSEFTAYLTVEFKPGLTVDKSRKQKLAINMNITFPKIPGSRETDNTPLPLPVPLVLRLCKCAREGWSEKVREQAGEGCNVHGRLELNRVAGNFHIAPGSSFSQGGIHVHDFLPYLSTTFDFSHTIHHLSFGDRFEGAAAPLNGFTKETDERKGVVGVLGLGWGKGGVWVCSLACSLCFSPPILYLPLPSPTFRRQNTANHMFTYFVKVIGTSIWYRNGDFMQTNQFAVTHYERKNTNMRTQLPGFFVNYEISPLVVTYRETQRTLSWLVTGVCSIVGGIFTVAGIVDSVLYRAEKTLRKKMQLGKAS